jgi:hypothetical protein
MGTGHRYRYMNYCGAWQRPLESYGDDSLRFMKQVRRKYDPHAMFQKACVGGFKLGFHAHGRVQDASKVRQQAVVS